MAIHSNEVEMVRAAIGEYLELARRGIAQLKPEDPVLGYPSATCLFAVVDAIGSFHRGDPSFTVPVDGKAVRIANTADHILILNSPYFGFKLSEKTLRALYALARSPLTHNALLGDGHWMWVGDPVRPAIEDRPDGIHIYLPALLVHCEQVIERFMAEADKVIPGSRAIQELKAKAQTRVGLDKEAYEAMAKALSQARPVSVTGTGPSKTNQNWKRKNQ